MLIFDEKHAEMLKKSSDFFLTSDQRSAKFEVLDFFQNVLF